MKIELEDRKRVSDAIRAAEQKTSGEIFCVMAMASSNYRFVPLARAAIVALAVPLPLFYFTPLWADEIYFVQLAVFAACAIVFSLPALRYLLVPRWIKRDRASAEAKRQFAAHGLHLTPERTGVLIFASLAERYVEIIADSGINDKVSPEVWDRAVKAMIGKIKEGRPVDGFIEAIQICGEVLAKHFPPGALKKNELPDRLVLM
ncbi:MAG TPA: TPM domain-containing protein [Xanthobacteraceae bacterium]|nr:TPM domain-containing protein [Xanthobacteraceae bacterium]